MSLSISSSTFANIDWSTLENRPPIDTNQFCTEQNWFKDVPCCISGYTIEHILESAEENGLSNTPEAKYLSQYPCLNGIETDYFYEKLTGQQPPKQPAPCDSLLSKFLNEIKNLFF